MAVSRKVHKISTKYFIHINQEHYVIYLQNIKFVQLISWPEGVYTVNAYATKLESQSHIRIHFMNHDYIGSFWQCQMSQKPFGVAFVLHGGTIEVALCALCLSMKRYHISQAI